MRFILSISVLLSLLSPAFNQEPNPDEPEALEAMGKVRLTLDAGNHVSVITRMLFTPDGAELITAGVDHTIRIWDPRTGELLRTLRPPGLSEALYPALSPDGKLLAVNAYYAADKQPIKHVIYLMSVADGRIKRVLEGHENSIRALSFSADGKRLASSAYDKTLRIWDLAGKKSPQVIKVAEMVYALALSPDGTRLVEARSKYGLGVKGVATDNVHTAALRDLSKEGKVIPLKTGQISLPRTSLPVAWSRDGKTVAVAAEDGLWLFEPSGKLRRHLLVKQETQGVAFSRDSRRLLVATRGSLKSEHTTCIFDVDTGKMERKIIPDGVKPAPSPVALCAFSADGALVATGATLGGGYDTLVWRTASGELVTRQMSPSWLSGANLKAGWSSDGKSVAWRYFDGPAPNEQIKRGRPTGFDFGRVQFRKAPLAGAEFKGPLLKQGPYELSMFKDKAPQVIEIEPEKKVGKKIVPAKTKTVPVTISAKTAPQPGFAHSLVGANRVAFKLSSTLFLIDLKTQKRISHFQFKDHVRSVAPSPNGRYLLVLSGDQILHILNADLTREILSLYVNDQEWIAWTPEGYYAASPGGERLMGWTVNHGIDKETSYHPASRFRAALYRPDVIQRVLTEGSVTKALAAADKARGKASKPVEIAQVLPPDVKVTITPAGPAGKVTVDAEAQPQGTQPITALQLLIDDRPYTGKEGLITIDTPKAGPVKRSWQIDLPPGSHDIRVLARTDVSLGSSRGLKRVEKEAAPAKKEPNLYVLVVGINAYPGALQLKGAVSDARNLSKAFKDNSAKVFGNIEVKEIIDKEGTRAGIFAGLDWLKTKATANDVTVFFFAGHGERDKNEFYLVPQDVQISDLAKTGVSRKEIKERVQRLPGRVLVLLDACHSGAIGLLFDDLSRELTDEDCGVAVMCAARPSQFALEAKGQGFFTQSLVGGLAGKAPQRNGSVFLHNLQSHVIDQVSELSQDRQHPVVVIPPWMRPFALSRPAKSN